MKLQSRTVSRKFVDVFRGADVLSWLGVLASNLRSTGTTAVLYSRVGCYSLECFGCWLVRFTIGFVVHVLVVVALRCFDCFWTGCAFYYRFACSYCVLAVGWWGYGLKLGYCVVVVAFGRGFVGICIRSGMGGIR